MARFHHSSSATKEAERFVVLLNVADAPYAASIDFLALTPAIFELPQVDETLPKSHQREVQRQFRARRAAHLLGNDNALFGLPSANSGGNL